MWLDGIQPHKPVDGVLLDNTGEKEEEGLVTAALAVGAGIGNFLGIGPGPQPDVVKNEIDEQKKILTGASDITIPLKYDPTRLQGQDLCGMSLAEAEAKETLDRAEARKPDMREPEDICLGYFNKGDCSMGDKCKRTHLPNSAVDAANCSEFRELIGQKPDERHICAAFYINGKCTFESRTGNKCKFSHVPKKVFDQLERDWKHKQQTEGWGKPSSGQRRNASYPENKEMYGLPDVSVFDLYDEPPADNDDDGPMDWERGMDDRTAGPTVMSAIGRNSAGAKSRNWRAYRQKQWEEAPRVTFRCCPSFAIHGVCRDGKGCVMQHMPVSGQSLKEMVQVLRKNGTQIRCPLRSCRKGTACPLVHAPVNWKEPVDTLQRSLASKTERRKKRSELIKVKNAGLMQMVKKRQLQPQQAKKLLEDFIDGMDDSGNGEWAENSWNSSEDCPNSFEGESTWGGEPPGDLMW